MCASSGTRRRVSASSTAAEAPGNEARTFPRATPAAARESIAAGPIS